MVGIVLLALLSPREDSNLLSLVKALEAIKGTGWVIEREVILRVGDRGFGSFSIGEDKHENEKHTLIRFAYGSLIAPSLLTPTDAGKHVWQAVDAKVREDDVRACDAAIAALWLVKDVDSRIRLFVSKVSEGSDGPWSFGVSIDLESRRSHMVAIDSTGNACRMAEPCLGSGPFPPEPPWPTTILVDWR